jgi:hypothetical protein
VSAGLPAFRIEAGQSASPCTTRYLGVISAVGELNAANLGGDIKQGLLGAADRSERKTSFFMKS